MPRALARAYVPRTRTPTMMRLPTAFPTRPPARQPNAAKQRVASQHPLSANCAAKTTLSCLSVLSPWTAGLRSLPRPSGTTRDMKKFSKRSQARKERGNLCVWFASALESSEDCTNLPVLQATLLSKLLDPNTNLLGLVGLLFVAPQRSPHPVAAREAVHRPASTAGNHVHLLLRCQHIATSFSFSFSTMPTLCLALFAPICCVCVAENAISQSTHLHLLPIPTHALPLGRVETPSRSCLAKVSRDTDEP